MIVLLNMRALVKILGIRICLKNFELLSVSLITGSDRIRVNYQIGPNFTLI